VIVITKKYTAVEEKPALDGDDIVVPLQLILWIYTSTGGVYSTQYEAADAAKDWLADNQDDHTIEHMSIVEKDGGFVAVVYYTRYQEHVDVPQAFAWIADGDEDYPDMASCQQGLNLAYGQICETSTVTVSLPCQTSGPGYRGAMISQRA
jgi:hypothetical protein